MEQKISIQCQVLANKEYPLLKIDLTDRSKTEDLCKGFDVVFLMLQKYTV